MTNNTLAAQIAAAVASADRDAYHRLILSNLAALERPQKIANEAEYAIARAVKTALCSVSCTTSNTSHPDDARVWAIESAWGKVLHAFNARALIQDSDTRLLANYLLWNRRLMSVSDRSLMELAAERGILRQREGKVYVVGLYKKVGNNVFTVDSNGREHRQFMNSIGRQAFSIRWDCYQDAAKDLHPQIPPLPEDYEITGCYDGKYGARTPGLTRAARCRIVDMVSQWEAAGRATSQIVAKIALNASSAAGAGQPSLPF